MIGPKEQALRAQREARVTKTVTKTSPHAPKVSVTRLAEAKAAVAEIVNRGGRPKKANALTPAQKQKAYRERMRSANG